MLGNRRGFNYQLNDTTRKFTYFVPRDKAWNDARISYPSAVKVLFMPDFAYHVRFRYLLYITCEVNCFCFNFIGKQHIGKAFSRIRCSVHHGKNKATYKWHEKYVWSRNVFSFPETWSRITYSEGYSSFICGGAIWSQ